MCIWYRQSAAYTSLAPRGQVDGWTAKPSPLSIHGRLSEFSRIICGGLKRWKIRITYRKWSSNFPRSERKPVYEKKNRELRIQWLWLRHFSRLRTKIDNWKICHKPIWPFTWKISSVGKDKVNEWEFCELKITPIAVFVIMIQRIFPSFFLCDFYSGIVISLFLFFNKIGFYCQ